LYESWSQTIDYCAAVGHLIWLLHTRPDIAYAFGEVSRYVQNPGPLHFVALKRIFRYLRGTSTYGLYFKKGCTNTSISLEGFSDSDWAGDVDTRRSTSGYLFLVNDCPISFKTKKQTSTALSLCEAEVIASSLAAAEAIWLNDDLSELGYTLKSPVTLWRDNRGSIAFSSSEVNRSKMKHIALRESFIRELVRDGFLESQYVNLKIMLLISSLNL
jgi:hypothetical protein